MPTGVYPRTEATRAKMSASQRKRRQCERINHNQQLRRERARQRELNAVRLEANI